MVIRNLLNGPTVYPVPVIPQVIPQQQLLMTLVRGRTFTDEYQ